jgi:uncharacterized protein YaaR (DUF327 family)
MRIDDLRKPKAEPGRGENGRGRTTLGDAGREATFLESLEESQEEMETRALIQELDRVGEQLFRFPSTSLMAHYRSLVRSLIGRVQRGLKVRRDFKWRRAERSLYVTVQRVDEALKEMERILAREGDRTRILALTDEIKGCLISLLF